MWSGFQGDLSVGRNAATDGDTRARLSHIVVANNERQHLKYLPRHFCWVQSKVHL